MGYESWDYLMRIIEGGDRYDIILRDNETGDYLRIEADLKDVLEDYENMMSALAQIRKAASSAII